MTLIFYVICSNRGSKDEMIFIEKESTEILEILYLINNRKVPKIMAEENND